MHMLGRKKGMMTISCSFFNDPLLRSSEWCQAVLVITRITKLIGMLRLKIFWRSVNGRGMYDHSETENRGNKCYIISNTVFSYLIMPNTFNGCKKKMSNGFPPKLFNSFQKLVTLVKLTWLLAREVVCFCQCPFYQRLHGGPGC